MIELIAWAVLGNLTGLAISYLIDKIWRRRSRYFLASGVVGATAGAFVVLMSRSVWAAEMLSDRSVQQTDRMTLCMAFVANHKVFSDVIAAILATLVFRAITLAFRSAETNAPEPNAQ